MITSGYYGQALWINLQNLANPYNYRALLFYELTMSIALLCLAIFCFILMLKRKAIFPKVAIGLYVVNVFAIITITLWVQAPSQASFTSSYTASLGYRFRRYLDSIYVTL